jgi:hypothetical protein
MRFAVLLSQNPTAEKCAPINTATLTEPKCARCNQTGVYAFRLRKPWSFEMFHNKVSIVLAAAALAALTASANAQTKPRHRHRQQVAERYYDERPPLTVNRRSFLDPGPAVPVGSMSNYVTANTIFNRTPDQIFARSSFGNDRLPQPLEVPGRPQPVVEFETPAYDY